MKNISFRIHFVLKINNIIDCLVTIYAQIIIVSKRFELSTKRKNHFYMYDFHISEDAQNLFLKNQT